MLLAFFLGFCVCVLSDNKIIHMYIFFSKSDITVYDFQKKLLSEVKPNGLKLSKFKLLLQISLLKS